VSLLESDQRKVPAHVQPKLVALLDLPANHLPLGRDVEPWPPDRVASALGNLGYAGFAHMASRRKVNPTELVARTLTREHVEARLVEALPWLLVRYPNLEWEWLVGHAKQHDVQNRLGFVVTVARELAERSHDEGTAARLRTWEAILERSRLPEGRFVYGCCVERGRTSLAPDQSFSRGVTVEHVVQR
jgi:hypothetical protein